MRRPWGIGPEHWKVIAQQYGHTPGKAAHTLWLKVGAELGVSGLGFLILFYGLCVFRLWPLARKPIANDVLWLSDEARMVIASLAGFVVAAQFVAIDRLEIPYYIALLGVGVLKLCSTYSVAEPVDVFQTVTHARSEIDQLSRQSPGSFPVGCTPAQ